MQIRITGDENKVEVRIVIVWKTLQALLKAMLLAIGAVSAFLSAPEIIRLIEQIGR